MEITRFQLNHIINLYRSLGKSFDVDELLELTIEEASDLITKLRIESNERLKENYDRYFGIDPHPSEYWRIK